MKVIADNTELIGKDSEQDETESTSISSHGINHASYQESIKPAEHEPPEHIPEYIKSVKPGLDKLVSILGEKELLDSRLQNKEYCIESRVLNFLIEILIKYYDAGNSDLIRTCVMNNIKPILAAQGNLVLAKENQTFLENKLVCDLDKAKVYAPVILRFAGSKLQPETTESLITLLESYNEQLLNDTFLPNIAHVTYLLLNSNLEGDLLKKATDTLTSICSSTDSKLMGKLRGRLTSFVDSSLEHDIQLHDITGFILAKTATEIYLDQEGDVSLKKDSRLGSLNSIQKLLKHNQTICEQSMELLVENLRTADVSVITNTLKVFSLISKQNGYLSDNAIYAASGLITLEEKLVKEAAIDFLANVCSNSKYDYGKLIDPNLAPPLLEEVLSQNKQAAVLLNAILKAQETAIAERLCLGYLGEDRYLELEKILAGSESSPEAKYIATLLIKQAVLEHHDPVLPQELLQVLSAAADNVRSSDHILSLYSIEVLKIYFNRADSELNDDVASVLTACSADDLSSVLDIFELKEGKLPGVAVRFLAGMLVENADDILRSRAFGILTRVSQDKLGEDALRILEIEEIARNLTAISGLEDPDVISRLVKDLNILSKLVSEGTRLTRSSFLALEGLLRGNIDKIINCATDLIEQVVSNGQEIPPAVIEKLIEQIIARPGSGSLLKTLSTALEQTEFSSEKFLYALAAVIGSTERFERLEKKQLKKELLEILPQAYPDYNKPFEEWHPSWWGKKSIDEGNFEQIKSKLPGLRKKAEENNLKKELLEILPQAYPAAKGSGYNKPFDEWDSSWYGKKVLDANNFESIKSHLPGLKKKAEENNLKKELLEILPQAYPDYNKPFEEWHPSWWGKKVIDSGNFEEIKRYLPELREKATKIKEENLKTQKIEVEKLQAEKLEEEEENYEHASYILALLAKRGIPLGPSILTSLADLANDYHASGKIIENVLSAFDETAGNGGVLPIPAIRVVAGHIGNKDGMLRDLALKCLREVNLEDPDLKEELESNRELLLVALKKEILEGSKDILVEEKLRLLIEAVINEDDCALENLYAIRDFLRFASKYGVLPDQLTAILNLYDIKAEVDLDFNLLRGIVSRELLVKEIMGISGAASELLPYMRKVTENLGLGMEDQNADGENLVEVLKERFKSSVAANHHELNEVLYQFAVSSKFSSAKEKDLSSLLAEIEGLNKGNPEIADLLEGGKLGESYLKVVGIYGGCSKIVENDAVISTWEEGDIKSWSAIAKTHTDKSSPEFIEETIAVIKRANKLFCGHDFRIVQIISLLSFFMGKEGGRLLQISTGEGKSTTAAGLAIIKALQGYSVDIVTSSPILARRDAEEKASLFAMFGLSARHNCDKSDNIDSFRGCYDGDIVYGDVANFQYDVLRHEYKGYGTRGKRVFECVIVDEVDSMLIDDSGKIAMLASHLPGSEYIEFLYSSIWLRLNFIDNRLEKIDNKWVFVDKPCEVEDGKIVFKGEEGNITRIDDTSTLRAGHLEDYINDLLSRSEVKIPEHLKQFVKLQIHNWIKTAIMAKNLIQGKDYVIIRNEKGYEVIAPVDYRNTGLIHTNTNWINGLHQFLQIKHGLRLSSETLTTGFISNMEYFKRYGHNIYGMSGTLGSSDSQDLLKSTYGVDLTFIPTYKEKQFLEIPAILTEGEGQWYNQIISSIKKQVEAGRALLVINESIKVTQQIRALLLKEGYAAEKIKIYSSSLGSENEAISGNIDSGDIILATNLAGRGTDIKTTSKLEKRGGLHVIVTFLPTNSRVEEQAFGRTSRQGNKGSGQIIANTEVALDALGYHNYPISNLGGFEGADKLKDLRNHVEGERLLQAKLYESSNIGLDDELFKIYSGLANELKSGEKNQQKLQQLEELWGIKLKELKLLVSTREEERELKEIARRQGFKVLSVGDRVGSIYRAISLQLEHSITADELQGLALTYLLRETDPSDSEAIRKVVEEIDNLKLLKVLSSVLKQDIILISNNGSKDLHIKNAESTGLIYLGVIAETKLHPSKWYSLEYLRDTGSIKDFKEINVSSSLFKISREDLCGSKTGEALKYLRAMEVVEAGEHNRNLREAVLKEFEQFKNHVTAKYKEGYSIISNPAYMVRDAYNRMGGGNSYEQSISILKQAVSLDPDFSFAAYYNLAYCTIRHGEMVCAKDGKAWTTYTYEALGYLMEVKNQIEQNIMPNLSVIQMLSEHQGETPLMRQVIDKIELLKKQLAYIEKIIPTMTENVKGTNGRGQNSERSYIVIDNADVKLLKELYDSSNAPLDEIGELNSFGIIHLYGVRVEELPVDWGNVILTAALGIGQLIVGCACALSGNIQWAATFIMNGFEDLMKAGNIANNEDFRWSEYGTGKAINYGVALALAKIDSIVTGVGMFSNEAAKKIAEQGAKHCITEVAKEIALRVAINKTVDGVFNQGTRNLAKEFNPELERLVSKEVGESFSNPELRAKLEELLIMDSVKGNRSNQQKLHNSAMSALKQHGEELRAIISGLVNGLCGSHDPRVKLVGYLGKTISIGDALMKINDLTDKVCRAFEEKAGELAAEELDLARFICNKLGIRLNLSEAREIVQKLEDAGIIKDGRLQAEKVLLKEGDQRNPRALGESERPDVFKQNLGSHNDLIAESLWQLCKAEQPAARSGASKLIDAMESELKASITKAVLSRVQHQVVRPAADSYISDIKKNITEELKNIHEDIQSSISGKPRVYGNWDNKSDSIGKRIADIFRIRDEKGETAKRLLQTEIIEQRLAFESMGINARNIDTNYVMGDLLEGGQDLAGTSEKDKTGKQKQPTSNQKPYDYSLLLAQQTDQELVQLNKQSMEYLKYFFEASEKKTQKAEEVKIYDVTRATDQSSMFSELFGIPTAYGNTVNYNTLDPSQLHARALGYGIRGVIAVGRSVLSATSTAFLEVATKLNLEYNSGLRYANDVQRYTKLASGSNRDITITSADYALANSRGVFDPSNPYDMESLEHIARGIAIERSDKQVSLWTANLPDIDFKVIGRVDYQGHNPYLYFDIDANTGKPTILPIPYQPKSILLDNSDRYMEWNKLPGFSPSMVKTWQEYFPYQGQLPDNYMSILYKNYPYTVDKINAPYSINGDLPGQKYPLPKELQEKYQDMLPGIDSYTNRITPEISRESLHDALVILKASEVGYSVGQLVNDQVAYNTSKDILNLDLTVAALNKFADTHDGAIAGAATRVSKELVDIRQEVIKGGPSFSSIWEKTKANLVIGKTSILNPTVVGLDVIGNMIQYVEDKVGYIVASNMPKTTATLKAGLGYAMEKAITTGLEGAVEVFGQENVESTVSSLKNGLNWVDEHSTKGHQKLIEYAGIYSATKIVSQVFSAFKHGKIPHLPEEFFGQLPTTAIFETPEHLVQLKPLYKKGADYFDSGIDVIGEAISKKVSIQDLPKNIQKDFAALIKTDSSGIVTGIHHMQNHHVLLKSQPKFQELFAKAEMSIDEYVNTVFLPDHVGKSIYPTNKSLHSGMHSSTYYADTLEKIPDLLEKGAASSWTPADYRNEILKLVEPLRADLNSGKIQLNNAKTLLEKVNEQ